MNGERNVLRFVIGTAGHIDHGKSTLVQCLTGIDPDRLEEEKRRGMTIDLGFAHIKLPDGRIVGFIDVPGHEKFVRNMVAGATAIHAVLFVVAADDSVMPQTEEHLAILKFLDIKDGLVVITKADLVDEETLELVRMDVEETVAGSFLQGKPIIPISAVKGIGIDSLVAELGNLCDRLEGRKETGLFRYFVQRVFSSSGFGTVLTGVTVSGSAKIGDIVEVLPGGQRGRIRNLQAYRTEVQSIFAGHCGAINISDLRKDELGRGMVAGTPEYLRESSDVEVLFSHIPPGSTRPLKDYSEISFHAGSMETIGKIAFMGGIKHLEAGGEAFAQLKLTENVVVWPGMRFIIRRPSPPETLGGGVVLAASGRKFRRTSPDTMSFFEQRLAALGNVQKLTELVVEEFGEQPVTRVYLCSETGLLPQELQPIIDKLIAEGSICEAGKNRYASRKVVEDVKARIVKAITDLHAANPLSVYFEKSNLRTAGSTDDSLFDLALAALVTQKKVTESSSKYQLTGYKPPFSQRQQEHIVKLIAWFGESIYDAHSVNIASEICGVSVQDVEKLFSVLRQMGEIVSLPDGVFLSRFAVQNAERKLREHLEVNGTIKSADFKNVIGAGRKVAIALLDHFEKAGVTFRKGGEHALRKY